MNFLDCFFLTKPQKLRVLSYDMNRGPSEDTRDILTHH